MISRSLIEVIGPGCEDEVGGSVETEVMIEVEVENPVKVAVEVEADVDFEMEVEVEVGERLRKTQLKSQGACAFGGQAEASGSA